MQRGAPFDFGLDVEDELAHGGLVIAGTDDFEGLDQRYAGRQHGGELATEHGDVAGIHPAAMRCLALLANPRGCHPLTTQLRAQRLLVCRDALALDAGSLLVAPLP